MKSFNRLAIIVSLLLPVTAFALDIGNTRMHSELFENLNVDIPLTNTNGIPAKELTVNSAPIHAYYLRGMIVDPLVKQLIFHIKSINGEEVLNITSSAPINEPILNFLVEFKYPQGELVKEITLLPQLPGQGDEMPVMLQKSISNIDFNAEINTLEANAKKIWQTSLSEVTYLTKTGKN